MRLCSKRCSLSGKLSLFLLVIDVEYNVMNLFDLLN